MTRSKSDEPSLAKMAISSLREMISIGDLHAGQKLSRDEIIEKLIAFNKLNVSPTPLRVAIEHFCSHGIMEVHSKKDTQIRDFTAEELRHIWNQRLTLEREVLRVLAGKEDPDLSKIVAAHRRLTEIVEQDPDGSGIPTDEQRRAVIDTDEKFHEELCAAAGYPQWKEELRMLRLKLRLASPAAGLVESRKRMKAIVQEHKAIVVALQGGDEAIRPDHTEVQYAFLFHMRNAARDSWKIKGTEAPILHYAFEMPDLPPSESRYQVPLFYPFLMRYCAEMNAVWNLALRKEHQLGLIDSNHNAMRDLLDQAKKKESVSAEIQREFNNHDINLHSGICFLGGIIFGEDIITYVWRKLHDLHNLPLTVGHMTVVVNQHDAILHAIKNSRSTVEEATAACDAMAIHLSAAFIGHNLDKTEQQETSQKLSKLANQLKQTWVKAKQAR